MTNSETLLHYDALLNDINSKDATSLELIINCTQNLLSKAEKALSNINKCKPSSKHNKCEIEDNIVTISNVLESPSTVKKYLSKLDYTSQGKDQSGIFLYGDHPYVYNKASEGLSPVPLSSAPIIEDGLKTVNTKTGYEYNSILVNHYADKNTFLKWHKDNEKEIDKNTPIATLSIGAVRRFVFSADKGKTKNVQKTFMLQSNSLFTMGPSMQDKYYHQLCTGRSSRRSECGIRYSLTFRKIVPATPSNPTEIPRNPNINSSNLNAGEAVPRKYDAVVFGSSLTKGLNENVLSKDHRKSFRVFSHAGAHVSTIISNIRKTGESNIIDTNSVSSVFLICGGNDIEHIYIDKDIDRLCIQYDQLIDTAQQVFPNAKIKLVSLLPRRSMYVNHYDRIYFMNAQLESICEQREIRFVNIFSHFVDRKSGIMNIKLYHRDRLHFNSIGTSVLAKVLIGVANRPWA